MGSPMFGVAVVMALALSTGPALAQGPPPKSLSLSLAEAIELALTRSHAMIQARLAVEDTEVQVEQARSAVYPSVDGSLRYIRTLEAPNPFAGSGAGEVFGGLSSVGWLEHNENARLNGGQTMTLQEYLDARNQGLQDAGVDPSGGANPFLVENELTAALTINQIIYNGAAFTALDAAAAVRAQTAAGVEVEALRVVDQVSHAYLGALLAEARVVVLDKSVGRVEDTLEDTRRLVEQGVQPKFQQLTAEVELANLQTQRIQATDAAHGAREALLLALGLPSDRAVGLTDDLALGTGFTLPVVDPTAALAAALEARPDLRQLDLALRTRDLQTEVARAAFLPIVSAFANLSYSGRVPDDRSFARGDPMVPFKFSQGERDVFDDGYWNSSINVGVQLTWNLFNGLRDAAEVERSALGRRQLEARRAQLTDVIRLEVIQAVRALETAAARIRTQERNIARAEQNYAHARARVKEGVSSQLELRGASQQLDETRFNHLQAVHDYLVAWTRYEVAVGTLPGGGLPMARPAQTADPEGEKTP